VVAHILSLYAGREWVIADVTAGSSKFIFVLDYAIFLQERHFGRMWIKIHSLMVAY
jgi:hypothetical protein